MCSSRWRRGPFDFAQGKLCQYSWSPTPRNKDRFLGTRSETATSSALALFAHCDAQRLHLAVEMAALQAQHFRRMADVVAGLFNLLLNVFALVGVAGLLQA